MNRKIVKNNWTDDMEKQSKKQGYIGKESDFQITCAIYLNTIPGCVWFHTPNETMGTKSHYTKRAKIGVKKGVPDIMILNRNHGFNGLAIELKVGKNQPSEFQIEWLKTLDTLQWKTLVCRDLDEFIQVVDDYFGI